MGGRGSAGIKHFKNEGRHDHTGSINPIHVAGMNRDVANGVNPEKTLEYIEKHYKSGMTKEQLQILDDDGWVIQAFQGGRDSVSFDGRLIKGKIYTHNHPGKWGCTFSKADINSLGLYGKEMRASSAEGVYSMKATKKANPGGLANALAKDETAIKDRMRKISQRVSRMGIVNPQRRATINRRLALGALNRWYLKNAEKFGYEFKFIRNKGYKI